MTKARFPNVVEADLFMRMKYDSAFGIFDHDAPDRKDVPWPLLYVSPREDLSVVDPLDFRLDQYIENRVQELTGVPFHELIQFPRRDFLKVISSCKKHSAKLYGGGNSTLKNLERMLAQNAGNKPPTK